MILEYAKVRVDAIEPQRANPSDAGLDVFYCPSTVDWSGIGFLMVWRRFLPFSSFLGQKLMSPRTKLASFITP